MRVRNETEAESLKAIIGNDNVAGVKIALTDGASVWIFQSEEEIAESELTDDEKKVSKDLLAEMGGRFAGWVRPPMRRQPIPGLEPVIGYDSHGNYRGGGSNSGGNWSH
ncbi:MAG: hypothetical protein HW383_697 [Candidatus Magasanikbacteria bacterium]|nr:hypothetical protein [Candidatus Magasanikbacteria bacterium]